MPNRSKYYSNRGNCQRAAKVVLGKTAKLDSEFTLIENPEKKGEWAWKPTARSGLPQPESNSEPELTKHQRGESANKEAPTKRKRAANGEKSSILQQPQMAKVIGLMQRQTGASVEEIAERIGSNRDTARGMVSRCKSAGAPVTTTRESRFVRYLVDAEWGK